KRRRSCESLVEEHFHDPGHGRRASVGRDTCPSGRPRQRNRRSAYAVAARRRRAQATRTRVPVPRRARLDGTGTVGTAPTPAARPVSVKPVPMVPTSVAAPVVRLIVNSCAGPPVDGTSEAKATPVVPEMSKPTRSEVLKPRPAPMVVRPPPLGDGTPLG